MNFLTSSILSGGAWDGIKCMGIVTSNFLKDKLNGWILSEEQIDEIAMRINKIPEGYKKTQKYLEAAIDDEVY